MSAILDLVQRNHTCSSSISLESDMSSNPISLRRSRPSQVQTNFTYSQSQPTALPGVPQSAVSGSSASSSSQHGSPIMSPEPTLVTTNSSVQVSPDPPRGRDEEQCPAPFQLPEPILSRKTSNNSITQGVTSSPRPTNASSEAPSTANGNKGSIIRRFSNRAQRFASRRRQSSAAPTSRDGSVGPSILRRRSNSNTTAPPEFSMITDTDEENDVGQDEVIMLPGLEHPPRESTGTSSAPSINSTTAMAGPVLPAELQNGCGVFKLSNKSRPKRFYLTYETESNKLVWDKTRPNKCIHVDDVREVRRGADLKQNVLDFSLSSGMEENCFTVIYTAFDNSKVKYLHLLTDNAEIAQCWIEFLDAVLYHRQEIMSCLMSFDDRAIAQYWQSEMSKHGVGEEEELDVDGVKRLCSNLHIYSSPSTVETNFYRADARRRERLNFAEFQEFVRYMKHRPDVRRILRTIAANSELGITLPEFLDFIRNVQGEDVDSNTSAWERQFHRIVRKSRALEGDASSEAPPTMSEAALISYLSSKYNPILVQEPQEYTLDRPMNEYIISSSHNTYLLGRQVAGQSSVEGYIAALSRGCRCVEVDCWDGNNGQPEVNHGRTLTTSISFREVMTTINKYAFVKSRFPLWISLEVHCSPMQQAIMAEIIKESFGSRLVTEPLESSSDKLPSPSQLMERILIKVKKPNTREDIPQSEPAGRRRGNSLNSPMTQPTVPEDAALMPSQSLPQNPMISPSHSTRRLVSKARVNTINERDIKEFASSSNSDNESSGEKIVPTQKSANKTVKVLGDLGVYCAGVKFGGFDSADAKKYNHIFSFMETSFAKHARIKEEKMALDIHNMRYLMRVYPDRFRISSNNFDPIIYWRRGVQMAALNWQTFDLGMQLNRAMFQGGKDTSGYVLKPAELRDIQVLPYNSDIAGGKKERSVVSFSIDVVSAQQLMQPANFPHGKSMDPYVEVEVFHANDKRDKKEVDSKLAHEPDLPLKVQTAIIRGNGFNPFFDKQFKFKVTTKHPELIFVRWSVKLSNDGNSYNNQPAIATYTAKLVNLKQGYRTLPLLNHSGDQYLFSTLFCKIKVDSIEKMMIEPPRRTQDGNKLNRLGGRVFGRINSSPKSTMEKSSMEKTSFEGLSS